jgi:hypothetical protein
MFRFTIRDLLWLTLVMALVVGWWIDQRAKTQRIDELEKAASGHMMVDFSDLSQFMSSPATPAK